MSVVTKSDSHVSSNTNHDVSSNKIIASVSSNKPLLMAPAVTYCDPRRNRAHAGINLRITCTQEFADPTVHRDVIQSYWDKLQL